MKFKVEKVLITGAAGFIGSEVAKKFINNNIRVLGVDNLNNYYSQKLKRKRIESISNICKLEKSIWNFQNSSIQDKDRISKLFEEFEPDIVINLAAQAGVRYSIINPYAYCESNLTGFLNILESCRSYKIKHLIYASSSSVYGGNKKFPFKESDTVDHPVSFYAATKKSNEIMAHSYSQLYGIPATGLRFFTVYGPWGRPDMAPMIFSESIMQDKPINIFNNGEMSRDFTYIEDVVDAVFKCSFKPPKKNNEFDFENQDPSNSFAPHLVFNVGNGNPTNLLKFIEILEICLNKKAKKNFLPMQPGDVVSTYADINKLKKWIKYKPLFDLKTGISNFVRWYLDIYRFL